MPGAFQSLLVLLFAVLPGAIYLWGFEREAGKWGIGLSDTLLRFVAASALFLAIYAYPLYPLYVEYLRAPFGTEHEPSRMEVGDVPWWVVVGAPLMYVLLPAIVGSLAGLTVRSPKPWVQKVARVLAGKDPAPRAWDDLFADRPSGLVRARLKKDTSWIGGKFGGKSYAAGYPEEPMDLLLEATYALDPDGTFRQQDGEFVTLGSRLLIRWEEIDFLEFFPQESVE